MRIKKLIVRKTKPSEEIIREVVFNEKGLNLIVDNTSEDVIESGNSVGKSTAIKIIDLCLGAKSVRELYYDSDTKSENVKVREFLKTYKVQAELILSLIHISNFSSVAQVNFECIKFDKTLIEAVQSDRKSYILIQGLVRLFHELGIQVIAEGTETRDQVDCLLGLGADLIQGYYYAMPMPGEELRKFLK